MLTKQERAAIAKRLKDHKCLSYIEFYEAITGEEIPKQTSRVEDIFVISRVILDLCDTSNMVELPRDKDGEVIHAGDTVYDNAGRKLEVDSIRVFQTGAFVIAILEGEYSNLIYQPFELTHKKPVTVQELSDYMQAVIYEYGSVIGNTPYVKLLDIANQLKELAGQDD